MKMPQSLSPPSTGMPVSVHSPTFKQSTIHPADSLVTINASAIMSTIQQATGTTNSSTSSIRPVPKLLDVAMTSHQPNTVSLNGPRQTVVVNLSGKLEYNLSAIVKQNNFFHMTSNDATEHESAWPDVHSMMNRQFSPLLEVEEKENAENSDPRQAQGVPQYGTVDTIQPDAANKLHIQPNHSLSKGLKKFSYPIHNTRWHKQEQAEGGKPVDESQDSASDASEPEDNGFLYGMRRIQSHPDIHELTEMKNRMTKTGEKSDPFDDYKMNKPKSVPTTPLPGSPKSIRKQMKSSDQIGTEIKIPAYSFLASVAHQTVEKLTKIQQTAAHTNEISTVVATKNTDTTVTQSSNLIAGTGGGQENKLNDAGKSQGFVNSLKAWAFRKPVNVSSKETNMFSPQSF